MAFSRTYLPLVSALAMLGALHCSSDDSVELQPLEQGGGAGSSGAAGTSGGSSGAAGSSGTAGNGGSTGMAGSSGNGGMSGSARMAGNGGSADMAGNGGSAGSGGGCQPVVASPSAGANFTEQVVDQSKLHGQSVEAVHMPGDCKTDLVVALSLEDAVILYTQTANGFSEKRLSGPTPLVGMDTVTADFDKDGDLDVVAAGFFQRNQGFQSQGEIALLTQGAGGTWSRSSLTGFSIWGPRTLAAADFTGNGKPDIIVGSRRMWDGSQNQSAGVNLIANNTNGFGSLQPLAPKLVDVNKVVTGDFDGNGVPDIVAADLAGGKAVYFRNQRQPGSTTNSPSFAGQTIVTASETFAVAVGNFDNDPADEVVVAAANRLAWFDAPAGPMGSWTPHPIANSGVVGWGGGSVQTADFKQDGRMDIALGETANGRLRIFLQNANGSFSEQVVASGYTGLVETNAADVDGDGRPDLLTSTYNHNRPLRN